MHGKRTDHKTFADVLLRGTTNERTSARSWAFFAVEHHRLASRTQSQSITTFENPYTYTPFNKFKNKHPDFRPSLFLTEALGFFDGETELLDQLLVALVRRQVEAVEARVRARQPRLLANLLDAESLRSVAPCHKTRHVTSSTRAKVFWN